MEFAILNIAVLIIIIIAQWARFDALAKHQARVIKELESDNEFWLKEAQLYSIELHELKNKTVLGK